MSLAKKNSLPLGTRTSLHNCRGEGAGGILHTVDVRSVDSRDSRG